MVSMAGEVSMMSRNGGDGDGEQEEEEKRAYDDGNEV